MPGLCDGRKENPQGHNGSVNPLALCRSGTITKPLAIVTLGCDFHKTECELSAGGRGGGQRKCLMTAEQVRDKVEAARPEMLSVKRAGRSSRRSPVRIVNLQALSGCHVNLFDKEGGERLALHDKRR